ncbi:MAG: DUF2177 family protein [Hyphomicrobiaceae bacterium]|nr:DUF2177 family protein [Hyphomicrobiaceae bacterium]
MKLVVAYLAIAGTFLVLDLLWLGVVASGFYRSELGPLMATSINLPAAVGFYILYTIGVLIFVVAPALESGGWTRAMMMGALFGLVAYATYDLTNLAVMRGFPASVAFVDMAWGTVATALVSCVAVVVADWLFP